MKKFLTLILAVCLLAFSFTTMASGKVMLYSSMQEAQLQAIKDGFEAKYPDITLDYYFASGGKVITKMSTEAQAGQIEADVVWLGDPTDYESFKKAGYLQPYTSPETDHIADNYIDKDGYYTAARLVTMGIAWCGLEGIGIPDEEAPKTWNELLDPKWKDQLIMTDPAQSSTSKYWVAAMMQNEKYGPAFFEGLRDNGLQLESGTTATHNVVAAGSYDAGICLDYVSANLINEGSPIRFQYTTEDVCTMTSPVALIANCANPDNGKLLIDFILSKEGQEILVANNLVSVRDDVEMDLDTSAIAAINMTVDFEALAENADTYLEKFNEIFNK